MWPLDLRAVLMGLEILSCLHQESSLPDQESRLNSRLNFWSGSGVDRKRQSLALAKLVLALEADSAEVTGSPSLQYLGHF